MQPAPCDVIGLGVIAVDDMLYVDSYPSANTKMRVRERRRQGGGTVSCGLAAAARLGSRCRLLGRLGDNELSRFVHENLGQRYAVDMSLLQFDAAAEPVYCVIVVANDTGDRSIYGDYNRTRGLEPDELQPEWFAGAKVLLVDHYMPPTILAGVKLARQAGLQVVSDIERLSPEFAETKPYIDHLICSEHFAQLWTKTDDLEQACRELAASGEHRTVVVTAGALGCWYCTCGTGFQPVPSQVGNLCHNGSQVGNLCHKIQHVPAYPVKAVDTTGCGDVFHGVFCHGLAQGRPIEEVIRRASAGGAIKATRPGGWAAVPTVEEIEQMLVELRIEN